MDISSLALKYVIGVDVLFALQLLWILRRQGASGMLLTACGAGAAAWIGALHWAFGGRHIFADGVSAPVFFAVVLAGVAGVALLYFLTPLARIISSGGQALLLLPQNIRIFVGIGFAVEGLYGLLPAWFSTVDGFSHVTAAFLALSTAILLASRAVGRGAVWLANLAGLLDIVMVAATIAFVLLKDIGPHHNMMYVLFFVGPLLICLHLSSLWLTFPKDLVGREAGLPATVASSISMDMWPVVRTNHRMGAHPTHARGGGAGEGRLEAHISPTQARFRSPNIRWFSNA